MTNINPNDGVNKINNTIKKEKKVNKKKEVVAQQKQVEASALNALGAYGKANVNFKGSIQQSFEQKKENLLEKINNTFGGENGILSEDEIDDITYNLTETNLDLAYSLIFGKTTDGKDIIKNKKLAIGIIALIKEAPETKSSLVKKDNKGEIFVDFDFFFNTLSQLLTEENDKTIEPDFIKQIFDVKTKDGKYAFTINEVFEILSEVNDENFALAKKLLFKKDETGKEITDIHSYLKEKGKNYRFQSLKDILKNTNNNNKEFVEKLCFGKTSDGKELFSEKELIPNLALVIEPKTISFVEEILFTKKEDGTDLFPDKESIQNLLYTITSENVDFARELCFSNEFTNLNLIGNIIRTVDAKNIELARFLCFGKDKKGNDLFPAKNYISNTLYNLKEKENKLPFFAEHFYSQLQKENSTITKEEIKEILQKFTNANCDKIIPFVEKLYTNTDNINHPTISYKDNLLSFINNENVNLAEKLCFNNKDFTESIIKDILIHSNSENISIIEDLCFGENAIEDRKEIIPFLKTINKYDIDFVKSLYYAKKSNGEKFFTDSKSFIDVLKESTPENSSVINLLLSTKKEDGTNFILDKKTLIEILREINKDNLPLAKTLLLERNSSNELLTNDVKDFIYTLRATKKDNLPLAKELCSKKDDKGNFKFNDIKVIQDILFQTTSEKITLAKELCFENLYPNKKAFKHILGYSNKENQSFTKELLKKLSGEEEKSIEENELLNIIYYTNKDNISLANKLCFNKDENGNDLKDILSILKSSYLYNDIIYPSKISEILKNTNTDNIKLAEKLLYGKTEDGSGKDLFPDKLSISRILSYVNKENLNFAEKICFIKDKNGKSLFNSSLILNLLAKTNTAKKEYTEKIINEYINENISKEVLLACIDEEITLQEYEKAIDLMIVTDHSFPENKTLSKEEMAIKTREKLNSLSKNDLCTIVKNAQLYKKYNINEIYLTDKKSVLRDLMKQNINLFNISEEIRTDLPLIPKNQEGYCSLVKNLVKSIGIETNEITKEQEKKFDNATKNLSLSLANLSNEEFANLSITQEYSKDEFIQDAFNLVKNMKKEERQKVYDYFGFELHHNKNGTIVNDKGTKFSIAGYPVNLNNGQKLEEIKDENTKQIIEQLRPYVIKFSENNKIYCDNKEIETALNEIAKILPEIRTFIGKTQHGTQHFDIMKHSLKVMQKIVQNPKFETLNDRDKKIMLLASLLHDSAKSEGNIDPIHAKESAFDAFYISQKFNLTKDERIKLYSLIENHEWLADINKEQDINKRKIQLKSKAYDLHYDNLFELSKIFTEADLKAVKIDDRFFDKFKTDFEVISKEVDSLITVLKESQPLLPVTPIPSSSKIKEAITTVNSDYSTNLKGIYQDENGMIIIKYNEVENDTWEKIGFPKGSISKGIRSKDIKDKEINTGNIHFFVHGLDYPNQLSNFDAFALPDSDALLSVSYAERPESKYRFFRSQGVILNADTKYVHGGGETDSGSGCGKNIDEFKTNYAYEGARRHTDRTFVSELIKEDLGLSTQEYLDLIDNYKNRPFTDIEPKELQEKIIKALSKINSHTRIGERSYNEIYISNPDVMGFFVYDWHNLVGKIKEFVNDEKKVKPFLKENAVEKDMPLIVFGD